MPLYEKPVRQLMHDMVVDLGLRPGQVFDREQVFDWFRSKYPLVKKGTIAAHLIRLSTNAQSRLHYNARTDDSDDLFFQVDSSRFRLYESGTDPIPITHTDAHAALSLQPMAEQSWKSAIINVLTEAKQPLHYREITERILSRGLKSTNNATPDRPVRGWINSSIRKEGNASPFIRVGRGIFALRQQTSQLEAEVEPDGADEVIRAFGMYWQRDLVVWRRQPRVYGQQQVGAKGVDFAGQRGIYILYDHHTVIYVGRAIDRPLGQRLYEHTLDRLSGRWNRFSWFGLYGVFDDGKLAEEKITPTFATLITALESILIETLEPPQNRRRGDDFMAVEYIQDIDPELKERELQRTLSTIEQKLRQAS